MSAIGSIINNTLDAVAGSSSGTSLQDFLSKFSSSDGKWISQIDPYSFFDVTIKFYPTINASNSKNGWLDNLTDSMKSTAMAATKNLTNNLTGGLLGSLMNSQVSIKTQHDNNEDVGKYTFMQYLAAANLLVGPDDWIGENAGQAVKPLELQLGLYCQEVTLPDFEVPVGSTSTTIIGEFPVNGAFVKTNSQILNMNILNTKVPLFERLFYPWMREVTLPWWSYESQPYTTATITIDMSKHSDIKYVFCGCRPQVLKSMQANQQADTSNKVRQIGFLFDYMLVTSTYTNCESLGNKLLSSGKTLLNSAGKLVNL